MIDVGCDGSLALSHGFSQSTDTDRAVDQRTGGWERNVVSVSAPSPVRSVSISVRPVCFDALGLALAGARPLAALRVDVPGPGTYGEPDGLDRL